MAVSLTGTRIREYRRRAGISQTNLAKQAGISISYLNLIEHNKRGIAGKILSSIARALDISTTELSEQADFGLLGTLQEAAAYRPAPKPEITNIAELVGRFPGWAGLLATLYRQSRDQEKAITALSDRLTHDPFLAESLHLMLSNITAIRSTAGILTSMDDIPAVQRARFDMAIKDESKRLSDAATALIEYFDRSADQGARSATPEEEVDHFLSRHANHFPALDIISATDADIAPLLEQIETAAAQGLVREILSQYLQNARQMPLKTFAEDAAEHAYNPVSLARKYTCSLHDVMLRLASLKREGILAPEMGLLIVNAAGHALRRFPLPGFPLPRHGNACSLWPAFRGFTQPGRPLENVVELPDGNRYITLTITTARSITGFGEVPDYHSAMLVIPSGQATRFMPWHSTSHPVRPVGTSCRICPRQTCQSRVESRL